MKHLQYLKPHIRLLYFVSIVVLFNTNVYSQTTFWTESFQNGCASGCIASSYTTISGSWTVTTLYPDEGCGIAATPNVWYVSGAECGNASGACGTDCGSTDTSLHIGSTSMGDNGATYDAGGWCPYLGDPGSQTNIRCESPNINTTTAGSNAITLRFNYIHFGQGVTDRCQLYYSINGGASWLVLENPIPKAGCCGGACNGSRQGLWTARSYALPATCNNLTNFKIAFNWINNDDMGGLDPSFAVDDIVLQYTVPLPITLLSFDGHRANNNVILNWKTASEINNDYFEVQRSFDGFSYIPVVLVKGSGNSNEIISYSYTDQNNQNGTTYYKLKQVDYDGTASFSDAISVSNDNSSENIFSLQTNIVHSTLTVFVTSSNQNSCFMEIKDVMGKTISTQPLNVSKGNNSFQFNISSYNSGIYFFFLQDIQNKKVIASSKFIKY